MIVGLQLIRSILWLKCATVGVANLNYIDDTGS